MSEQFFTDQDQTPPKVRPRVAADFRREARAALSGKWGIAVVTYLLMGFLIAAVFLAAYIFLIPILAASAFLGMGAVANPNMAIFAVLAVGVYCLILLAYLFVLPPITVGYQRFQLDLFETDGEPRIGRLFYGFKKCFWKSIGAMLLIGLRVVGILALMFVGFIPLIIICVHPTMNGTLIVLSILMAVLTYIGGLVAVIILSFKYSMTMLILADDPTVTAGQALARSAKLMRGNKFRYFCLQFSFIGWLLLTACCCSLGTVVLNPYMCAATGSFYRSIAHSDAEAAFGNERSQGPQEPLEHYFDL